MKKKKSLKYRLPQYAPSENLWDNIKNSLDERELNAQRTLKEKLPEYKAPDHIFTQIEKQLTRKKIFLHDYYFYKIAASILIIISIGLAYYTAKNSNNHTKISHHTLIEEDKASEAMNLFFQGQNTLYHFLTKECKNQPAVCESKRYEDLKRKLEELESEEAYLKTQISRYRYDDLTPHLMQIKKDREKVKRYLVSLFI